MKRRDFLATAALGATAAVATPAVAAPAAPANAAPAAPANAAPAAPAVAAGRRELTMIMTWPKNTPGVGVNAERFVDMVTALTDGRLAITLFGAGDVVPPFESLDAVASGTADLCHSTPYYWVGKHKALNYFTGVPFGLTAQELGAWLRFGGGMELWEETYDLFGVVPFYAGSSGTQAGGWFRKEINSPDDFRGLKFRIAGLGGEVLRRMGATTVMVPPGEIAAALMSGTVDGADWIGPWNDLAMGLYRAASYYYMPGLLEPGPGLEVVVNKGVWQSLPDDQKAAIRTAAMAISFETLADFTFHNIVSLEPLLTEHDVKLRHFNDDIVRAMAANAKAVLDDVGASDPLTARVHTSFTDFLRQARAYAPNAEGGYLAARTLAG